MKPINDKTIFWIMGTAAFLFICAIVVATAMTQASSLSPWKVILPIAIALALIVPIVGFILLSLRR